MVKRKGPRKGVTKKRERKKIMLVKSVREGVKSRKQGKGWSLLERNEKRYSLVKGEKEGRRDEGKGRRGMEITDGRLKGKGEGKKGGIEEEKDDIKYEERAGRVWKTWAAIE